MGLTAVLIGMVFLCNPPILVFDIIPDFIGYGLIIYGLRKLRDLSPEISDAYRGFTRMLLISFLKFVLGILCFRYLEAGYMMVLALVFAILEPVFGLTAFSHFYRGMVFLGSRYDNVTMLRKIEKMQVSTTVLLIVNAVATFLPQVALLRLDEELGYVNGAYQLPLYILAFLLCSVAGIAYLVMWVGFRRSLLKDDNGYLNRLSAAYDGKIENNPTMLLCRRFRCGLLYLGFGLGLQFDLLIDGINFTPDVSASALTLIGLYLLKNDLPKKPLKIAVAFACVQTVFSLVQEIFGIRLAARYYDVSIAVSPAAYREYLTVAVMTALNDILAVGTGIAVVICLWSFLTRYTVHEVSDGMEGVQKQDRQTVASYHRFLAIIAVLYVLFVVSDLLNFIFAYTFEEYGMIHLGVSLLFFVPAVCFFTRIRNHIENRYA